MSAALSNHFLAENLFCMQLRMYNFLRAMKYFRNLLVSCTSQYGYCIIHTLVGHAQFMLVAYVEKDSPRTLWLAFSKLKLIGKI